MLKNFGLFTALTAVTMPLSANALSILAPSSTWWWQTGNSALLAWDCSDTTYSQFSVLAASTNLTQLTAGYVVLVGQQPNDQCTTNIVPNLVVGSGYKILFTNIVNYTDIYATSEPFEVKAQGSAYPSGPTPHAGASSTTSAASATGNSTHTGGAIAQIGLSIGGAIALASTVAAALV